MSLSLKIGGSLVPRPPQVGTTGAQKWIFRLLPRVLRPPAQPATGYTAIINRVTIYYQWCLIIIARIIIIIDIFIMINSILSQAQWLQLLSPWRLPSLSSFWPHRWSIYDCIRCFSCICICILCFRSFLLYLYFDCFVWKIIDILLQNAVLSIFAIFTVFSIIGEENLQWAFK